MNDIANAIESLERKASADPDDSESRYQLAVLLLDEYGKTNNPEWLRRAREQLSAVIALRPNHARSHALLGYAYDFSEGSVHEALACFREARRLDPDDKLIEIYFLKLLEQTSAGSEVLVEIEAAALRHDVDLAALRRRLQQVGLPTDARTLLMNGFGGPRFKSTIADEAELIIGALQPGRARKEAAAQRKRCTADQRQLERSFDASRVPDSLRRLSDWASRYGVGDDYCRPYLLTRLRKKERAALVRDVDEHADAIHTWLNSFGSAPMPPEAAAFMYLALGAEEIRDR